MKSQLKNKIKTDDQRIHSTAGYLPHRERIKPRHRKYRPPPSSDGSIPTLTPFILLLRNPFLILRYRLRRFLIRFLRRHNLFLRRIRIRLIIDELGIHPDQIWHKTKSILNPFRVNPIAHKDSDLSGPIFLYLSFCLFQLLAGKIQFGVILGWIVVSSIFIYIVFNMLAGRQGNLDLHTCTSVVGYCMLPVVILSAISLFIPQGSSVIRFALAGVFVVWATRACTNLMVTLADGGEEHRGLIAYACFLIYTWFSLLVIF